jgi:hypothetical protein
MLIIFSHNERIVRAEFVPRGTTVNSEYYEGLLERLQNDVRRKRKEKMEEVLHHGNAPCHTSFVICQFLADKKMTVCPHPPYSPDFEINVNNFSSRPFTVFVLSNLVDTGRTPLPGIFSSQRLYLHMAIETEKCRCATCILFSTA